MAARRRWTRPSAIRCIAFGTRGKRNFIGVLGRSLLQATDIRLYDSDRTIASVSRRKRTSDPRVHEYALQRRFTPARRATGLLPPRAGSAAPDPTASGRSTCPAD